MFLIIARRTLGVVASCGSRSGCCRGRPGWPWRAGPRRRRATPRRPDPVRCAVRNVAHVGLMVGEHRCPGRLGVEAVHGPVVATRKQLDRHSPGQTTKQGGTREMGSVSRPADTANQNGRNLSHTLGGGRKSWQTRRRAWPRRCPCRALLRPGDANGADDEGGQVPQRFGGR